MPHVCRWLEARRRQGVGLPCSWWVLETELGSSRRAASTLNCWVTSPAYILLLERKKKSLVEKENRETEGKGEMAWSIKYQGQPRWVNWTEFPLAYQSWIPEQETNALKWGWYITTLKQLQRLRRSLCFCSQRIPKGLVKVFTFSARAGRQSHCPYRNATLGKSTDEETFVRNQFGISLYRISLGGLQRFLNNLFFKFSFIIKLKDNRRKLFLKTPPSPKNTVYLKYDLMC